MSARYREAEMERSTAQIRISRVVHVVGDITSKAGITAIVAVGVAVYIVLLATFNFRSSWESGFSAVASAITLLMLFVIQHTQSRQQAVTQLKLDELIRASPRADDLLIHLERADDEELIAREEKGIAHHASLREDGDDQ
jgi:low affinity Fe/Cu permease